MAESSLGEAARKSFAMLPQGQHFFSEYQRRIAEGKAEGIAEGRAEGLEGLRVGIAAALRARSVSLGEAGRARLDACSHFDVLTRWLTRAVTAATEADVFAQDDA